MTIYLQFIIFKVIFIFTDYRLNYKITLILSVPKRNLLSNLKWSSLIRQGEKLEALVIERCHVYALLLLLVFVWIDFNPLPHSATHTFRGFVGFKHAFVGYPQLNLILTSNCGPYCSNYNFLLTCFKAQMPCQQLGTLSNTSTLCCDQ